jgi:tetratricopeptide (TPR) repeat protein
VLANAYRQLDDKENNESALLAFNERSAAAADQRAREMRSRSYYEQGVHLLSDTNEIDKANQEFEKAISEMPNLDAAYYRMAQVSYLKNDLRRAVDLVREAIHRNAFEPEYYYVEAKCLESSDPASALAAIRKAVALRPGVSDFQDLLRTLERKSIR